MSTSGLYLESRRAYFVARLFDYSGTRRRDRFLRGKTSAWSGKKTIRRRCRDNSLPLRRAPEALEGASQNRNSQVARPAWFDASYWFLPLEEFTKRRREKGTFYYFSTRIEFSPPVVRICTPPSSHVQTAHIAAFWPMSHFLSSWPDYRASCAGRN